MATTEQQALRLEDAVLAVVAKSRDPAIGHGPEQRPDAGVGRKRHYRFVDGVSGRCTADLPERSLGWQALHPHEVGRQVQGGEFVRGELGNGSGVLAPVDAIARERWVGAGHEADRDRNPHRA